MNSIGGVELDYNKLSIYAKELLANPVYYKTIALLEKRLLEDFKNSNGIENIGNIKLKYDALITIDSAFRTLVKEAEYEAEMNIKGEHNG